MNYNYYKIQLTKILCSFCLHATLHAQSSISHSNTCDTFSIVNKNNTSIIYYDASGFEVAYIASNLLAEDIERVTGKKPIVSIDKPKSKTAIIIGTQGSSAIIDKLIKKNINTRDLNGSWERYIYKTIKNPLPNVDEALVIIESDRRGTAYGVFDLSQTIGVSPWYWWADVPTVKRNELIINSVNLISKVPFVKYRGVFLNDEDWELKSWLQS